MSMPRRAMKNMGLQACCLRCDEPDDAGSARCKTCIGHHESIRDKIAKAPPDDAFDEQLGLSLIAAFVLIVGGVAIAQSEKHDESEPSGIIHGD